MKRFSVILLTLFAMGLVYVWAQNPMPAGGVLAQGAPSQYYQTPISATAAINTAITLTIPAPAAGLYNYVCYLGFGVAQDGTATAINNAATTSTNFNSFAFNFSSEDVAQKAWDRTIQFGSPSTGCAKSTASGTATTFVSPAGVANAAFSWQAGYFQAP